MIFQSFKNPQLLTELRRLETLNWSQVVALAENLRREAQEDLNEKVGVFDEKSQQRYRYSYQHPLSSSLAYRNVISTPLLHDQKEIEMVFLQQRSTKEVLHSIGDFPARMSLGTRVPIGEISYGFEWIYGGLYIQQTFNRPSSIRATEEGQLIHVWQDDTKKGDRSNLHNVKGPAWIRYDRNGRVMESDFYVRGCCLGRPSKAWMNANNISLADLEDDEIFMALKLACFD